MNTLAQNPNVGMLQGKDGLAFNSASGYLDSSIFGYEVPDKLLEAQQFGHLDSSRFVYEAPGNLLEAHQFGHLDSSRFVYEAPDNLLEAHQFATPLDYGFNTLPLTYNNQQSTSGAGVKSAFDFPMNTLAQNPNVIMLQGTSGLAFHSDSGYLDNLRFVNEAPDNMLEAHQFGTPPDYGFCPPLPLVSDDQQSTSGTGQNMTSTAQDFWPRFEEQSQRLCKWLMSKGQWNP
uniref:uncharacterized protein LOC122602562 n=1 Tax=Erigeron canadensis TaxID=72917 RepID=UPI001CB8F732|nr:uncharacterized protein LOC122602562 [Erigeron canadensis]